MLNTEEAGGTERDLAHVEPLFSTGKDGSNEPIRLDPQWSAFPQHVGHSLVAPGKCWATPGWTPEPPMPKVDELGEKEFVPHRNIGEHPP
jgi:hypothetical protein